MRKIILAAILVASAGTAAAQSNSTGQATSGSEAGAQAQTGAITFEAAAQRGRISTTANAYIPPAMFGGANNCGKSDTFGLGKTGAAFGFAIAGESDPCNDREDTGIAYKLGDREIARMRFYCFGADKNRMAFEAVGNVCPATATAKGLANNVAAAPVGYLP